MVINLSLCSVCVAAHNCSSAYIMTNVIFCTLMWGFWIGPEKHNFLPCPAKPQKKIIVVSKCVVL